MEKFLALGAVDRLRRVGWEVVEFKSDGVLFRHGRKTRLLLYIGDSRLYVSFRGVQELEREARRANGG
jgi:hypothetical protein